MALTHEMKLMKSRFSFHVHGPPLFLAGGLVTSAGAAGVGAKVALIEENLLGGDWYVPFCILQHRTLMTGLLVQ